jgi:hypothetical protein
MLWWLVNANSRTKMPYERERTETLYDMPKEYNAVVRMRLEHYIPSRNDKALQKVILERNIIKNTAFGILDKPSLVGAVMPHGQQRSALEITKWVQYLVLPVGNKMCLLSPNYLRKVA